MTAYALLFRGVGGATKLPVARLREVLAAEGFGDVATLVASGNAVVTSGLPPEEVRAKVATACRREMGFTKDVHVASRAAWAAAVAGNPFPEADAAPTTVHVVLLGAEPEPARVERLQALGPPDALVVRGRVAYIHTPAGFGRSLLAERWDRWIGVPNTARNWSTSRRLLAMLDEREG
jgi:uncharacterized protein (DUF1697 family)